MPTNDHLDGQESDRDASGKFVKGHPGGPGRPRRDTERQYLAALQEACPPETWKAIVETAVRDAGQGDRYAREWLSAYVMGRAEGTASTLHELAVEEAAGTDPVARDATRSRESDAIAAMLQVL